LVLDFRFVDGLVVPASVHDVDGRFLHLNAAAEQASGRPLAYWRGRSFTELLPDELKSKIVARFRRAVAVAGPTEFETVFYGAGGRRRGIRAQYLPLRSGESVVAVLILAFDVREPPSSLSIEIEPQLTTRQREVLELVARGLSTTAIAERLTLSRETVRNHIRNVLRELNVHTRGEAVAAAGRLGLLAPPALRPDASAEPG
jgi:PAS domain S-box-containing protein